MNNKASMAKKTHPGYVYPRQNKIKRVFDKIKEGPGYVLPRQKKRKKER